MQKPNSVRAALTAAAPVLVTDPDKLLVFADAGTIEAIPGTGLSFLYRYTLHAILTDFAGDPNLIFAALVEWVKVNQNDLIESRTLHKDGLSFEVDLLNHTTCDLSIKLKLTETVVASRDQDGQLVAAAKPEPKAEWEYSSLFAGE